MFYSYKTKQSEYYKELSPENREIFLGITEKKILPTIDNLYYSVFVEDDGSDETAKKLAPLLDALSEKKAAVKETREAQPFSNGLVVTLKSAAKQYNICLSEPDIYDIFINSSENLPNKGTNRIHSQLRAFGLWTRGIDSVLDDSFRKIESLLADYDLKISRVQENRIDYCFHTNIKTDVNKIFNENNIKYFETTLDGGFDHFKKDKSDGATVLHRNYYMFGKKDGAWLARFYDKVKEVIEVGYKSFFFKMWHDNGLISFYDRYCMEYALEHQNVDYMEKAKLAFYVEFGTNAARREKYETMLNNPSESLADFRQTAAKFFPPTNPVINVEFQTMREFYKYSDRFIDESLKPLERECHPQLSRLYKILDNRYVFLNWLHGEGLYFADGKNEDGTPKYSDWWERIRNVKLGGIKADEKLLRKYEHKMDKKSVIRQTIGKIASVSVYDDRVDTDFLEDYTELLHMLTDNKARKMDERLKRADEPRKDFKSELLKDYTLLKAKKEMRLKNRKKKADENKLAPLDAPATPPPKAGEPVQPSQPNRQKNAFDVPTQADRQIKCIICNEIKPEPEFWTYGGKEGADSGKCKACAEILTEVYD
ncbi:MAG: hypothetical protein FWC70_12895 [Defluviitaleaceae bacterium]|nr:hypothetical protein [Defluviitaleaceae bacterium]